MRDQVRRRPHYQGDQDADRNIIGKPLAPTITIGLTIILRILRRFCNDVQELSTTAPAVQCSNKSQTACSRAAQTQQSRQRYAASGFAYVPPHTPFPDTAPWLRRADRQSPTGPTTKAYRSGAEGRSPNRLQETISQVTICNGSTTVREAPNLFQTIYGVACATVLAVLI